MRIDRIRLANYRGVGEHDIELRSGVTVIEGANEAGKSSLVEAIDLLLNFRDDSRDRRVEAVRPVHTGASPEVEIEFTAGPYRFTYAKRWSHKPTESATALEITEPRRELVRGRQAHEQALEIFKQHVDLDLWRALRVLQDQSLTQPELDQKSALMRALDTAAGTGNDSDAGDERNTALIDAAAKEYRRYFTPAKGAPTDEYQKAITALETARGEAARRQVTFDRVQQDIEEHQRTEQKLGRLHEAARSGGPALAELEQRHRDLEAAAARVAQLASTAKLSRLEAINAATALTARESLREEERAEADTAIRLARQAERAEAELERLRPIADAARQAAAVACDAEDRAAAGLNRAVEDRDHLHLLDELARLTERSAKAEAADAKAKRCAAELTTIRIDEATVKRLEKEHQKLVKAQASAEAASSLVQISSLDGSRTLTLDVDGRAAQVAAGDSFIRRLTDDTVLVIDENIRVRITPGNAERDQFTKLGKIQDDFAKLCASFGATGIEDAREQLSRKGELDAALAAASATISAVLDEGDIDSVRERIGALRARTDRYRAARTANSAPPLPDSLAEAQALLEDANQALKQARAESEQADTVADTHCAAVGKAETEGRLLRLQAADAAKRAEQSTEKLAIARVEVSDEDLAARGEETARAAEETGRRWNVVAAGFDAQEITVVAAQLDNERDVARRRENEIQQCTVLLAQLAAKLSNDRDAQERLNEAQAALIEAESEHERTHRRAMAAKRLYRTLSGKRDEAKRAYVEPFRQKLEWFARIVFGGQPRLVVDDNLTVTHRVLDGATVPYDQLSGGAREQIALCARLACASLVDPDDGVPVVIDDALGFTDPERLQRIGTVFKAAQNRSQVIVLTCMPDRYRGIGVADVIALRRNAPAAGLLRVESTESTRRVGDGSRDGSRGASSGTATPPGDATQSAESAVLHALRNAAEPLGKTDLIARSGIDADEWAAVIGLLLDRGLIERQGERRGTKYTVA